LKVDGVLRIDGICCETPLSPGVFGEHNGRYY
jgi:hypothetical protein